VVTGFLDFFPEGKHLVQATFHLDPGQVLRRLSW
jgi:hypothetical protein